VSRTPARTPPARPDRARKEDVYACLKDWIIYSELKPGEALNERELAERFGLSRTPLREVLQRLSYQRLIVIRPRQGIVVAPIDEGTVRSIFEVRIPLEKTALVLAGLRAGPEGLARLAAIVADLIQARDASDHDRVIRLDQQFHETIGELSGNQVLKEALEDLHNVCLRYWYLRKAELAGEYGVTDSLGGVLAALLANDPHRAASLYGAHILSFLAIFHPAAAAELEHLL
jgi:DNA-binding GntR family transcriptional regulator